MNYKIADIVFNIPTRSQYILSLLKDYKTEEKAEYTIRVSPSDVIEERKRSALNNLHDYYYKSLAIYRKISEILVNERGGMLFHCSAVEVGGYAYLFTGVSGSGKSTHARLWKKLLGDKMTYINDDKPILREIDGKFFIYGTPWQGKESIGKNTFAPIKAVCKITKAKENSIEKMTAERSVSLFLSQTVRFTESTNMENVLALADRFIKNTPFYELKCDISKESALLSYNTLSRL